MKGPGAPKNEEQKEQIISDFQLAMMLQEEGAGEEQGSNQGRRQIIEIAEENQEDDGEDMEEVKRPEKHQKSNPNLHLNLSRIPGYTDHSYLVKEKLRDDPKKKNYGKKAAIVQQIMDAHEDSNSQHIQNSHSNLIYMEEH